jgi:hypothetical protein
MIAASLFEREIMNREDFRTLAYGQYLRSHREAATIDIKEADNFVDGAMFAFDKLARKEIMTDTFGIKDEPVVEPIYPKQYLTGKMSQ